MLKNNTNIMVDLIYDKLFNNKQFEQFNCNYATNQCLNYSINQIEFEYNNKKYIVKVLEG